MLNIHKAQIYLFFLIIAATSCRRQERPDLSHIDLEIKIARFDLALDSLSPDNIVQKNELWKRQYGAFYYDYMQYMLEAGDPDDGVALAEVLGEIIRTEDFGALKSSVYEKYPDLQLHEQALTDAFKHIKYFFPEAAIPRFIAFFSGFSVQTPIGEGYLGIGLDMFLGADSRFYPALRGSIPFYISRRFTPENIVPRAVESYIREELYPYEEAEPSLLQQMVYHGSILYAMDRILPDVADSLKIGYTAEQLAWADRYERDIWAWFLQENLLYEYDYHRMQKYLGEAPFTPELGEQNESAPKLGVFLGWKIIRKFMERHPETSLKELMEMTDAQMILDESKYRGV